MSTSRSPSRPRIITCALAAVQTADRSSAASAWHSEPPIVPRLRTTGSAITSSASRNSGKRSASRSDRSRSTWRVSAPIRMTPTSSRMYASSSRSLMSTRCSGVASRSFIIGSRLWPPAITRASGPSRSSEAIAPSTLVARSYSNGAGVCTGTSSGPLGREPLARLADVLAPLVLLGRLGPDDGRARQLRGALLAARGVQPPRGQAAALDVAQDGPARAGRRDRRLAAEPRQRQGALRVDLADPRRHDLGALGEVAQPFGGGAGIKAVDEPHGVVHARLLDQEALERGHAGVEVRVDVGDDRVDGLALLDDAADVLDDPVEPGHDLAQLEDRRDEEVDEREHDQHDAEDEDGGRGAHAGSASSRITSSEPPYAATPAIVSLACCCVVSSSAAASRSFEPASAVAAIESTVGTMLVAASSTPFRSTTTIGSTTTIRIAAPIHTPVIEASARRRSRPSGRSPAARRGSCRTGR